MRMVVGQGDGEATWPGIQLRKDKGEDTPPFSEPLQSHGAPTRLLSAHLPSILSYDRPATNLLCDLVQVTPLLHTSLGK